MNCKTLKDYFPEMLNGNGLFTELSKKEWFAGVDPAAADTYMFLTCGEKLPQNILDNFTNDEGIITGTKLTALANVIYNTNINSWRHEYKALTSEYNPIENTDYIETHEGKSDTTGNNTNTTTGSIDTTGDVYGFNSSSAVHDNKASTSYNDHEVTSEVTSNNTNELTIRKHGNIGVTTNAEMITSDLVVWKNKFIDYMIKDICNLITLSIY